jgi:hypothetical protein
MYREQGASHEEFCIGSEVLFRSAIAYQTILI